MRHVPPWPMDGWMGRKAALETEEAVWRQLSMFSQRLSGLRSIARRVVTLGVGRSGAATPGEYRGRVATRLQARRLLVLSTSGHWHQRRTDDRSDRSASISHSVAGARVSLPASPRLHSRSDCPRRKQKTATKRSACTHQPCVLSSAGALAGAFCRLVVCRAAAVRHAAALRP